MSTAPLRIKPVPALEDLDFDRLEDDILYDRRTERFFFSDETSELIGPFTTEHEARLSKIEYIHVIL